MTDSPAHPMANCPNCHAPVGAGASYCGQCGQRQAERRVTVPTLLGEFFTNFFNVDSQLFLVWLFGSVLTF